MNQRIASCLLCLSFAAMTAHGLDKAPGTDPGPGTPNCAEGPGWFTVFDGTQASLDKYFFLPPNQSHGNGGKWWIQDSTLYSDQGAGGDGGVLFTKRQYKNVEAKLSVKPSWGNDGGFFFRSNAFDKAYQVVLDYHGGAGSIGGVWGESGLHSINYKPFYFNGSPDKIVKLANWIDSLDPSQWSPKMWKVNEFNWVHAQIFHDDPPWIYTFVNGYPMIRYIDNKVEPGNLTGYIGLQIHRGTNAWSIGHPNLYKRLLVRETTADAKPLASYPDWTNACGSVGTVPAARSDRGTLAWQWEPGAMLRLRGVARGPYALTVTDIAGALIFSARGGAGSFTHGIAVRNPGLLFVDLRGNGFRMTAKASPATD